MKKSGDKMVYRSLTVYTHDLDISERTKNALARIGIMTLNDLEEKHEMDFSAIRGLGTDSIRELRHVIDNVDDIFSQFEVRQQKIASIHGDVKEMPVKELCIGTRAQNALYSSGIHNVGSMIQMTQKDIAQLRNVGKKTRDEISATIEGIISEGKTYIAKLNTGMLPKNVPDKTIGNNAEKILQKGFDFSVIDTFVEKFGFKIVQMTEWFGLSRQRIYDIVEKRPQQRRDVWTGKTIDDFEKNLLNRLVAEKKFDYSDDTVIFYCTNNKCDDFACVFIYKNEIKCFFLSDLPHEVQNLIMTANFHRYTEREFLYRTMGEVVSVLKQKYYSPANMETFRLLASSRGMTIEEYSLFLTGYPYMSARNVTDEIIIDFFEANMVDGKVYISSDPKNQWIRSYASRNGYGIKEFIEFYGYEPNLNGRELSSDGVKVRHLEEIKQYIVRDNIVYLPTDSYIYKTLQAYTYNIGTTINEYLLSLGYTRTTERPSAVADVLERDMQVRRCDGTFEEMVFAKYPLIGSKIIKPETLEKLNEYTREYIDKLLREPWHKLTLRAEMQMTLALINVAKNWRSEDIRDFWEYISLQFGYRGNNAVTKLLQTALEDAMKKNHRLFVESTVGREFKSTVVIHALTTRKSWMALYDFLFDFYKNNLNWNIIPEDPLLDSMMNTLRKKLTGVNDNESELAISSKMYSFQEGIRKLILMRPVFTKGLFEKLIKKIDSLINSKEIPVKTYEEQLCEEWFKEKVTAIANTKRAERQVSNIHRDVAIDYSRIRAKYILKNENEVQLILPDIRLKTETINRATLVIYYNNSIVCQQNMSWYGNELGKTLNGVAISLPDFPETGNYMDIQIKIVCDNEIIYNSEETLCRRVLVFATDDETNISRIHQGNYTVVLPEGTSLQIENADITEVDSFKNNGLKAYFIELKDGYALTIDGKLLAFDSFGDADARVILPVECEKLPDVELNGEEYNLAYRSSSCNIIFSSADIFYQFIILKNGEKVEPSSLLTTKNKNRVAFELPITDENDICRIQIINLDDQRLIFDRSFMLISDADCSFDKEFYCLPEDYENAVFHVRIDDFFEDVLFAQEDDEVRVPFRNGEIHVPIPKIQIRETTGAWLNDSVPAWYIGDIPQDSMFTVVAPSQTDIKFFVGNKDIMYDGMGQVTIGNALQSLRGTDNLSLAEVRVHITGNKQTVQHTLARVCYREQFIKTPVFWSENNKLFWDQGGTFIGKSGREFTLTLTGEDREIAEFKLDENTESIDIPDSMNVGIYQFTISILTGSLFKKTAEVIAKGDCVIGDHNMLRFKNRRMIIQSITDECKKVQGRIPIRTCYIDQIQYLGIEDTTEGVCPVYSGVIYTTGYHGERYEFSYDKHTNNRGITKITVNPVRIVYLNDSTLCITDMDRDGLYYYSYYDKNLNCIVYALTDREYTRANRHKYSIADLYVYKTERIKNV